MAAAAAAAPAFALTPGLTNAGVIDWTTDAGKDIWKYATKSIYPKADDHYNGTNKKLPAMLDYLRTRANNYGWSDNGILDIDLAPGGPVPLLSNLLDNYGTITIDQVRAHVVTYINTPVRAAQDSKMLYQAIQNSISADTYDKVRNKRAQYVINGVESGELFLRLIISEAHVDTNATLTQIQDKIAELPQYIVEIKHNITLFNLYVEDLVSQLNARNAASTELLNRLFTAYLTAPDPVFTRYIEQKQNAYHDGAEQTEAGLMYSAISKYQARIDAGTWCTTNPEDEIVALKAELKQLKDLQSNSKKDKKTKKDKDKKKKGKSKTDDKNKKPDWMLKEPTQAERQAGNKKSVNGKEYHWCPHHKAWTRHSPTECRLGSSPSTSSSNEQTNQEVVIAPYTQEEDSSDE